MTLILSKLNPFSEIWNKCGTFENFSVLLQDINMRKPFKSSVIKDQQVVTLATRPFAIKEIYLRCEPPPALQKLNPYRYSNTDVIYAHTTGPRKL